MLRLLAVSVLLAPLAAGACSIPRPEQFVPAEQLLKRSKNIVLAEAIKAELQPDGLGVLYTFRAISQYRGIRQREFRLEGLPASPNGKDFERFVDHFDERFWSDSGGRSYPAPDCEIYPAFSLGTTYLVFLDKPYHIKSFEIVSSLAGNAATKDKWLQYVEAVSNLRVLR